MDKPIPLVLLVHGLQVMGETTYFFVRRYCENADYTTIIVEPADGANITSSYGSTTGWFDQNPEEDNNSAGRVLKLDVDTSKNLEQPII